MPRINTRERILEASVNLFSERGYRHTTTKMIAELAGVNEVTLFRQFGSKEGIVKEIIERRSAGIKEIEVALNEDATGDLYKDLLAVAKIQYKHIAANLKLIITLVQEHSEGDISRLVSRLPSSAKRVLMNYFNRMQNEGLMKETDNEQAAVSFLSPTFGFAFMKGMLGENVTDITANSHIETMVKNFVNVYKI